MLTIPIEVKWKEGHTVQRAQRERELPVRKAHRQEADVPRHEMESEGGMFASVEMVGSTLVLLRTGFAIMQILEKESNTPSFLCGSRSDCSAG